MYTIFQPTHRKLIFSTGFPVCQISPAAFYEISQEIHYNLKKFTLFYFLVNRSSVLITSKLFLSYLRIFPLQIILPLKLTNVNFQKIVSWPLILLQITQIDFIKIELLIQDFNGLWKNR